MSKLTQAEAAAWRSITTMHSCVDQDALRKVLVGTLRIDVMMLMDKISAEKRRIDALIDRHSDKELMEP